MSVYETPKINILKGVVIASQNVIRPKEQEKGIIIITVQLNTRHFVKELATFFNVRQAKIIIKTKKNKMEN